MSFDGFTAVAFMCRHYIISRRFKGESMPPSVSLYRWDELALEKVTEMISRKIVTGEREMLAQIYLKRGALVPLHSHESEQMTYILQGALRVQVDGEEIIVREGEVLHIPSRLPHQAEALDRGRRIGVGAAGGDVGGGLHERPHGGARGPGRTGDYSP